MDRIWAPWRLGYVSQANKDASGCFLCAAAGASDQKASFVLWRNRSCFSLLNRWPYNNGHILVAPLEHKADLGDLKDEDLADQIRMLKRCKDNLTTAIRPEGFNIGLNLGRVAGAGLPGHLHWHIVPRWEGDTNFMPVTSGTKVIPQSLEALWELLRKVDGQP